jgi:2-dehydropantoate 2-reductase
MQILIMGAGALGSVAGGFLAKAGHTVTLVGQAAHMQAIRTGGLHISGIWGRHHVEALEALTEPPANNDWDVILLTVKSFDTATAVRAVAPCVGAETLVCSYQNGLGNAETIAGAVGWDRTIGARVIFGARMNAPGEVEVTVIANPTAIGVYRDKTPLDRVARLVSAMNTAGIPTVFTEDIRAEIWGKVAYNCALNPLSALLDCPYGALADAEPTRRIMGAVIHELYDVAAAKGVVLFPEKAGEYVELFYAKLVPPTAGHFASMREDFRHKRRTEIDALNGAIAHMGGQLEVACPVNTLLTRLVHGYEQVQGMVGTGR